MNINITLLGQMITFGLLIWFTMKFVWPPLMRAMEARQKQIADGLAAGERGKLELELAQKRSTEALREAREHSVEVLKMASKSAAQMLEESKDQARDEGARLIATARAEIALEANRAKEQLRGAVAELAVAGAARILQKEIDAKAHDKLLDDLLKQL
ncbi:MAG: F0F1 ATP synthase subunit B [Sulfuricaulis sp.]|nr:F0F1 ATP synthase subunit B [Sulfuricaulis sp.]